MKTYHTQNFTIWIFPKDPRGGPKRGSFEHNELGEDWGGGLWFEGTNLTDYDGVSDLPKEVAKWLKGKGYTHYDYNGECQL